MTQIEVLIAIMIGSVITILTQEVRLLKRKRENEDMANLLFDILRVLDAKGIIRLKIEGEENE